MDVDFRGLQDRLRERVLEEIRQGKLTGLQLARETGFRQSHISNFLNSKRGLSLEAMDAVMQARGWKIADLFWDNGGARRRRVSLQANSPGVSWIPVVDAKNCHASGIPFEAARDALRVMSSRLEKRPAVSPNVRGSWARFVALRVSGEEAEAMAPKLARGAMAVIDRHAYAPERGAVYAIRVKSPSPATTAEHGASGRDRASENREKIVMRYVERVGRDWVMRAESTARALEPLGNSADIVGRVCLVATEM